ncbi:MAG: hypothetical protein V3R29_00580 [Candidatus Acidoferrales bacterium]
MVRSLGWAAALLLMAGLPNSAAAQVRLEPPPQPQTARINVTYTEPSDEGQAERLRDLAARMKPTANQLEFLDRVDILIVHTPREFRQRLGRELESFSAVSYVHGILFLSPLSWQRPPTEEALRLEMEQALVRYVANQLAGGNRLPDWLENGLVAVLTRQPFALTTAEQVARRAPLLLARFEEEDPAVGYWAVLYLVEERGGLGSVRQLLRLVAQRPDTFLENLQLTYGVPAGQLERDWRQWLQAKVEAEKEEREGPLIRR